MYAVVDLETTGGKPARHRVIEVAIYIHNGKRVIEHFSSLVNPQRYIPPFIQAFTGITNAMVTEAPTFEELQDTIAALTKDRVFVAHNVRFDYAFLRQEFKRCGQAFHRQQLCTVRLSRAVFPGQRSYSLGKLCDQLTIPIQHRHRAEGDAAATVQLLERIFQEGPSSTIQQHIQDEMKGVRMPPQFSRAQLEALPEDHGVYYFMNRDNQVVYIGKSKNIRQRILSHFSRDLRSSRAQAMKEAVRDIQTVRTGNDLIASLWESRAIKTYMPDFNRAQRRKRYRYGLFENLGPDGTRTLEVRLLNHEQYPLKQFKRRSSAEAYLAELAMHYGLCLGHANLKQNPFGCQQVSCREDCPVGCPRLRTDGETYETALDQALQPFQYPYENFLIIGAGRHPEEISVVGVQDRVYQGFGFIEHPETEDPEVLMEQVSAGLEAADAYGLIMGHLNQKQCDRIMPF